MHRGASCGSMNADSNTAVLDGLQSLWLASTDIKSRENGYGQMRWWRDVDCSVLQRSFVFSFETKQG